MSEIKSFLNTEVDKVSFCKTTGAKSSEEYLLGVLIAVQSKRCLDNYQISFQDTNTITFSFIKEVP